MATNAAPVADYSFYEKVAENTGRNVSFSFVGLGVTWILAKFWLLAAKGLFWLGILLNGLNTLQVLALTLAGIVGLMAAQRESKWSWAANAVRLVEVVICGLVMWWSAAIVGYR